MSTRGSEVDPPAPRVVRAGADAAGQRVDRVVADLLPELSRTQAARLVGEGRVLVDDRVAVASRRLKGGELIRISVPAPTPSRLEAEGLALSVLHEDADLIVVDKPAGLVVHPGAGRPSGTLVNALLHHCGEGLRGIGGEMRPGIVHRLDKGTSGVLVVAKTGAAHANLAAQFARREVLKLYLAVVLGVPAASGDLDAPIGRSQSVRTRMAVGARGGRQARTSWRRTESFGMSASCLEVRIFTGRTHQVRVHLAHVGHPVVGDVAYGRSAARAPDAEARPVLGAFPRPALHAWRLGFVHPTTGAQLLVEAPVPEDIARLLADLRAATASHRSRAR